MEGKKCSSCKHWLLAEVEKVKDIYSEIDCEIHGLGADDRAQTCKDFEETETK